MMMMKMVIKMVRCKYVSKMQKICIWDEWESGLYEGF